MKTKLVAATAASMLGSVGLLASFAPAAHAASSATTKTAAVLERSGGDLKLTASERQRLAAVRAGSTGAYGAVTLDDLYQGVAVVNVSLAQGGTAITTAPVPLTANSYTPPEILPAGTYTLTVTNAANNAAVTAGTFTVAPGADSSEVLYPTTATTAVLGQFTDAVSAVPAGETTISVRHTADPSVTGPIDVYVDGVRVVTALAEGGSADLTLPAGPHSIAIYKTGLTNPNPALYASNVTLPADGYVPIYGIDDSATGNGFSIAATPFLQGYQFTASDGGVFNYGSYPFLGSTGGTALNQPVVGGAESPDHSGYYLAASDGGVFAFGAAFEGSLGSMKLNKPIVGMATTIGQNGQPGYLLVASDGGVFAFNTPFYGSLGGTTITSPVVGIAADPSTGAYIIAQANGSVAAFGGAGTTVAPTPALNLNKPIVGITTTPDGGGYWLVASDGGVFAYGDAQFLGSTGGLTLNQPVVGIVSTYDGLGYTLIARDGGVFNYGDSTFYGSTGGVRLNQPIVGGIG